MALPESPHPGEATNCRPVLISDADLIMSRFIVRSAQITTGGVDGNEDVGRNTSGKY